MAPRKGKDAEVLTSRTALMNSFVRNKVYIEKNSDSMTAAELEARLSLIETNFNQFCNIQAKIEHDSEDASEYESRYEAEEVYCELKAKLLSCLGHRGRRQSNVGDLLNSTQVSRSSRLPKLKLPEFAGKFTEWTSWYNTFTTLIESDSELDELSKFIHLRSALGAGPLSAIEGLELTGPNYRKALRLLKDRYENKAIILQSHVQELFNLRRLKRPDSEGLRGLVDNVNAQLVALNSLSDDKEILDAVIFHLDSAQSLMKIQLDRICSKPHHELLHREIPIVAKEPGLKRQELQEPKSLHSSLLSRSSTNFLATAVVQIKAIDGGYRNCSSDKCQGGAGPEAEADAAAEAGVACPRRVWGAGEKVERMQQHGWNANANAA
ncbi:GL12555 [Drosophila persimilis]|uniref:GL12555 n=1 Tax=Drosophila persimilis TaxID=7234 RepID=B4GLE4_DROPE|nr:GL12555 [Drosophila persimilis]